MPTTTKFNNIIRMCVITSGGKLGVTLYDTCGNERSSVQSPNYEYLGFGYIQSLDGKIQKFTTSTLHFWKKII